jgi:hypothetical protein
MALIIGVVSQKGGVGKSTIARLIARELAAQAWEVKIADLDISQATSYHWRARRLQRAMEPDISIEQYGRVDQALKSAEHFDLLVLDGAPHATQATQQIAMASDLVIIPTGLAVDDLQPGVPLARICSALVQAVRHCFTAQVRYSGPLSRLMPFGNPFCSLCSAIYTMPPFSRVSGRSRSTSFNVAVTDIGVSPFQWSRVSVRGASAGAGWGCCWGLCADGYGKSRARSCLLHCCRTR